MKKSDLRQLETLLVDLRAQLGRDLIQSELVDAAGIFVLYLLCHH